MYLHMCILLRVNMYLDFHKCTTCVHRIWVCGYPILRNTPISVMVGLVTSPQHHLTRSTASCSTAVFLLRKLLMSKRRVRLNDYELDRLKKVKSKLSTKWAEVVKQAEDDQKYF